MFRLLGSHGFYQSCGEFLLAFMSETRRKWIACQCAQASKSGYYSSFTHYTHRHTHVHTHALLHFAFPTSLRTFLCRGTALYVGQVHDIASVPVCEVNKLLLQRIPVQGHGFFLSSLLSFIHLHHSGNCQQCSFKSHTSKKCTLWPSSHCFYNVSNQSHCHHA